MAGTLGGLIGLEREAHGRAAGFRTHLLLGVGCCLVMILSREFAVDFPGDPGQSVIRLDPARLAYSVMGGIGFIGAGAVIRSGLSVRGLTTAASLWCVAAVGLAAGCGKYALALCAAVVVLLTLSLLDRVSHLLQAQWYKTVHVVLPDEPGRIESIRAILEKHGASVQDLSFKRQVPAGELTVDFAVRFRGREHAADLYDILAKVPDLRSVRVD